MLTVLNLNWAEYQRGLTVEIQFADSEDQVSDVSMHGLRFSWESQIKDSKKGRKTNNELNLPVTASSSWQTRPTTWLCWRRVVILSRIWVQSVLLAPLISQLVFSQNHQVSWAAAVRDIFQLSNIFFLRLFTDKLWPKYSVFLHHSLIFWLARRKIGFNFRARSGQSGHVSKLWRTIF